MTTPAPALPARIPVTDQQRPYMLAHHVGPVLPCRATAETINGKHYKAKSPYLSNGFHGASRDPKQIEAWQRQYPGCLWGVWAGAAGLVVLDIDMGGDKDGWASLNDAGIDPIDTFTQTTMNGGEHYLYAAPDGVQLGPDTNYVTPAGEILDDVDRRAGGSYFIWYSDEVPTDQAAFAPAPAWLLRQHDTTSHEVSSEGVEGWRARVAQLPPVQMHGLEQTVSDLEGREFGHDEMMRAVAQLVRTTAKAAGNTLPYLDRLQGAYLRGQYDTPHYRTDFAAALDGAVRKFSTPEPVSTFEANARARAAARQDTMTPTEPGVAVPLDDDEPISVDRYWPTLDDAAMHGLAGAIVRELEPTTEADPAAMLAILLASFGSWVGSTEPVGGVKGSAHMMIANQRHAPNAWPIPVGTTSSGAKGTGQAAIDAIDRSARRQAGELVPMPARRSGLSSGEGLIEAVIDASGDPDDEKNYRPGVEDKRMLIVESEFATVLRRQNREGSTLGPLLRQFWDGGEVSVLNRQSYTATNPHVVIIGHISPGELRSTIKSHDIDGGTLNRFLFIASRRSKRLPDGGNAPSELVERAGLAYMQAAMNAQHRGEVTMTADARMRWRTTYSRLTAERPDTVLTKATGRRAPQVLRLAMLYALIDNRGEITPDDLAAAEALEQYSVDTARYIFEAPADKDSDELGRLSDYIRSGGVQGRARNEIREDLYGRKVDADTITVRLKQLIEAGAITEEQVKTSGRPKTQYRAR